MFRNYREIAKSNFFFLAGPLLVVRLNWFKGFQKSAIDIIAIFPNNQQSQLWNAANQLPVTQPKHHTLGNVVAENNSREYS